MQKVMKLMKQIGLLSFIFLLTAGIFSCERTDPNENGRLSIQIYYNGEAVDNAVASISTSKKNLDLGNYVKQVHANIDGLADFGALPPGSYYCDAFKYINNNEVYLYGYIAVTVEPGHRKTVELNLEKK